MPYKKPTAEKRVKGRSKIAARATSGSKSRKRRSGPPAGAYPPGVRPDLHDPRDWLLLARKGALINPLKGRVAALAAPPRDLPREVSYRDKMPAVMYQGDRGTCVACALTVIKEYQERVETGGPVGLSAEALYQWCKERDWVPGEGTTVKTGLKVLVKRGIPMMESWPYGRKEPEEDPDDLEIEASVFRAKSYAAVNFREPDEVRSALVQFGPLVAALKMRSSPGWDSNGLICDSFGDFRGYHAVALIGYCVAPQGMMDVNWPHFVFQNSWGSSWGEGGIGYITPEVLARDGLCCWSLIDLKNSREMPVIERNCRFRLRQAFTDVQRAASRR